MLDRTRRIAFCVVAAWMAECAQAGAVESEPTFLGDWANLPDRVWIGPDFWANRLQDWRIRGGQLECVETSDDRPMRTVHLLTRSIGLDGDGFELSVEIGTHDASPPSSESWAGFLIGAGAPDADYRLTALTHHWPGADGGLIAVLDGSGRCGFRDNSIGPHRIGQPLANDAWPLLDGNGFGTAPPLNRSYPVLLKLSGKRNGVGFDLALTAVDIRSNAEVHRSELRSIPEERVRGSVALVSHRSLGPPESHYRFARWTLGGDCVQAHSERARGPVLCTMHTLSRGVLKLTAQLPPLGPNDTRTASLEVRRVGESDWSAVESVEILADSYTAPFRLERWDGARAVEYRVAYDLRTNSGVDTRYYAGRIPAEPDGTRPLVLAAFTGTKHHTGEPIAWNHSSIWFPHTELVSAVRYHRPDLLFFSGDQLYEGDLTGAQREPLDAAILDYLDKWYRWCWAFEELTRDVPCVAIPDDHDVYHGNIWGAGGRHAERPDDGGYTMPARFINAVQRTQTSHLPDPIDPEPVEQGIGVYFTEMIYGGVCFAIIEDRKFKSSPTALIPDGKVVNGFFQNPAFDPATQADVPGAQLLGERQIRFLHDWAERTEAAAKMKAVLSQTIFSNVSTLPRDFTSDQGTPGLPPTDPDALSEDYRLIADADSNGWPQSGRNAALREMRRASAVHICGDQHLGIVIRYGMDAWNDGPYAFCVPSIANTWPRRWYPPMEGANREPGSPPYTGEYRDAFGNRMTVLAAANPTRSGHEPAALYDRAPGYGVIRFDTENGWVRFECWPRWIDPREAEARQYPGWPITVVPGES